MTAEERAQRIAGHIGRDNPRLSEAIYRECLIDLRRAEAAARKAALEPLEALLKRYCNVAMQVHCEMGDTAAQARHRVEQEIEVIAARRALAESESS